VPGLLITIGVGVAALLLRAWLLDRKAKANGQVWVPVKERGTLGNRTRMVLVDRGKRDTEVAQRLYEEQARQREALRSKDPAAAIMRPVLRRRGRH
jgi:hypothetical protein